MTRQVVKPASRPVIRFAPSPNGYLHLGHAFSALFSYEVATALGGRFLLRIEDIDTTRARKEFTKALFDDLEWLGLEWETPVRHQSAHMADYRAALERLENQKLLFSATASRKEISEAVALVDTERMPWPRDPDGAPHFPRTVQSGISKPGPAARRLDMRRAVEELPPLAFSEIGPETGLARHRVGATPAIWGDPVLARKDIGTSYHLAVVVDDALQGITHVTRGTDVAPATHLHRLLQYLLGLPTPTYCHHGLLLAPNGAKLSKSAGSRSIGAHRGEGMSARDIRKLCGIDDLAPYFSGLANAKKRQRDRDGNNGKRGRNRNRA